MKITLRELFLLVVIAAMACGWWVERNQRSQLSDKLRSQAEALESRDLLVSHLLREVRDREFFSQKRIEVIQKLTTALKEQDILWHRGDDGEIRLSGPTSTP
jgi:hypothetical protein